MFEVIDLSMPNGGYQKLGLAAAAVVSQMPLLKYLDLTGFEPKVLSGIFSTLLGSSSLLQQLKLGTAIDNDETLLGFGSLLATNTSMKVFEMSNKYTISVDEWSSFFRLMQSSALEEVCLRAIQSDTLFNFLTSNQAIRVLKISGWSPRSMADFTSFISMLRSHSFLEQDDSWALILL